MINVAIHGAEGRMGQLITNLVQKTSDCKLVGLITEPGGGKPAADFCPELPLIGQDEMERMLPPGTVIIDFSLAPALKGLLAQGKKLGSPLVIGTTGFDPDRLHGLRNYAQMYPVVFAANFSIGIPTLKMLLELLAKTLPKGFDAEQVETHHITKLDKPSGTALSLAECYAEHRECSPVPTHSQRLGGVIGEHTWTFSDQDETITITHRAHSRDAFLKGIIPSVRFVSTAKEGLYDLPDVLKG